MRIYLYEFQLRMPDGATYLPYASGLLASYAKAYAKDKENLEFFLNDDVIVAPDVVGYSVSQWNLNRSIEQAKLTMKYYPSNAYPYPRIIFGGPSSCQVPEPYDRILGEGEYAFLRWLESGRVPPVPAPIQDLDDIPSPYVEGLFDGLVSPQSQAIIETVRGCPFGCAYCSWGKGSKATRLHSLEYVEAEAEWMGINKIKYVFCADGNFGMYPRDPKVAKIYANVKRKYGYPERFRVCFGKNAEESIFETASILAEAGLVKSVTLSRQSTSPDALSAVGRQNVSQKSFDNLQDRYAAAGIPTYSELILGLPGETYESWKQSIIDSMRRQTQLFLYPLSALPGTRLADLDYRMAHGIRTKSMLLTPVHAYPPSVPEYEDVVVETNTLDPEEWRRAMVLNWLVQLFYSFKLLEAEPIDIVNICEWMADPINLALMPKWQSAVLNLYEIANGMLAGKGRCVINPKWGGTYWEPEEVLYLLLAQEPHGYLAELVKMPIHFLRTGTEVGFNFEGLIFNPPTEGETSEDYAKRIILRGRKSNMKKTVPALGV